jgi:hypothetical protein
MGKDTAQCYLYFQYCLLDCSDALTIKQLVQLASKDKTLYNLCQRSLYSISVGTIV